VTKTGSDVAAIARLRLCQANDNLFSLVEKIFFSWGALLADNHGSTLNRDNLINRLIRFRCICLVGVALFLLSGPSAMADPTGDFLKKVGRSISKAFQPQPTQRQTKKKTRSSGGPDSGELNAAGAAAGPLETPSPLTKEEILAPIVMRASAVPAEKAKGDMPYGIPVPGQKSMVMSPYSPSGNYVDVSGFVPGTAVKDPYTGKIFRVP
jgi:hypothetical protein